MIKNILITLLNLVIALSLVAQQPDSLKEINNSVNAVSKKSLYNKTERSYHSVKSFIIPTAFVTFGFIALGKNYVNKLNINTKSEIQEDNPNFASKLTIIFSTHP